MTMVHDPHTREDLETRLRALAATSKPRWGKMSVDQMLWHVSDGMAVALGEKEIPARRRPLPGPVIKFVVLSLPWMKSAPTLPEFVAEGSYDFDAEKSRCLRLIRSMAARPIDGPWPVNPLFGKVTGQDVSRLHAKHLDHHLKQFGG